MLNVKKSGLVQFGEKEEPPNKFFWGGKRNPDPARRTAGNHKGRG